MTHPNTRLVIASLCLLLACCNDEAGARPSPNARPPHPPGTPVAEPTGEPNPEPTYWSDIAPLFAENCMRCHAQGGIAPFPLDDYDQAKSFATLIEHVTRERIMPPWSVTSDGSCGDFQNSEALSDAEIQRISRWVQSGAPEGKRRLLEPPTPPPSLAGAREFSTPDFEPKIQGGELAESDEYRCFALDAPSEPTFITGYEILPGRPEIVHHVAVLLVDPNDEAELDEAPGRTNGEQMRVLDGDSPDREGWPCFGQAGDGLTVAAVPVVWAPGQGVVIYPNDSGVPLRPEHKIVVQVHYNLANEADRGKRDSTTVRLQTAAQVENIGIFVLQDEFLDTLFDDEAPETLPPGQTSTRYHWTASGEEIGMGDISEGRLYGVMPHMHELGRKYTLTVRQSGDEEHCAARVENWDFHWQRMYFYEKPWTIRPDTELAVTCDFDTSGISQPVKPGWGTRNEMCLATLYFTVPASAFEHE